MAADYRYPVTGALFVRPVQFAHCGHTVDLIDVIGRATYNPNHCALPVGAGHPLPDMRLRPLPVLEAEIQNYVLDRLRQTPALMVDAEINRYLLHHPEIDLTAIPEMHEYLATEGLPLRMLKTVQETMAKQARFQYQSNDAWDKWSRETPQSLAAHPERFYKLERILLFDFNRAWDVWQNSAPLTKDQAVDLLTKLYEDAAVILFPAVPVEPPQPPHPFLVRMEQMAHELMAHFSFEGVLGTAVIAVVITLATGWEAEAWLSTFLFNLLGCYLVVIAFVLLWGLAQAIYNSF
jgi:hypothetical protein